MLAAFFINMSKNKVLKSNFKYSDRQFLNKSESGSTGNVVAFHGKASWGDAQNTQTFIRISDCHVSATLHKVENDSVQDFINKLAKLEKVINNFRIALENNLV